MGIGPRWAEYWRHRATEYLMGQVLPGARKSMEPMAARLSDVAYHEMQQFITNSPWDWEETQGGLIDVARTDVGTADALIPIDDTAFVKQGDDSVGVARQYCGILGKVANCQVAVTMVYLVPDPARNADGGVFPLGIRLFLPEEWADGTKGELKGWFARVRVRVTKKAQPTKEVGWLLFERRDDVLKAYLCHGFDTASLEELVRVARGRWGVEKFHRETKDELGLDHFEGRRWTGWYHHTTLTLLSSSFFSTKRWQQRSERPEKPLPPLPEIRRGVVEHVVERL